MKQIIKRFISILSAAALTVSGMQGSFVFADADYSELTQGDLTYHVYSDHAVVAGCDKETTAVTVPREVSGVPVTEIGTEAFYACGFESVQLPDTLKIIHDSAFSTCKVLKTVVIPEGVTEVGTLAFEWCLSLESAFLPDSLISVSEGLFIECPMLTKIELGRQVREIGAGAFNNDRALNGLTLPDTVTKIGEGAFKESGLNSIIIPDGITKLEESLFEGCHFLTSVTIPDSVTEIEGSVFGECYWIPDISIPESVTKIGYAAFKDCYNLQSVNLPDAVTEISDNLFKSCHSLREFTIPDQITRIGEYAFDECEKLETVTIGKGVQEIGICAFRYTALQAINVNAGNSVYSSVDGVLFNSDQSTLLRFPERRTGSYVIPDSVRTIGESAFEHTAISQVIIPETVTKIEDTAFMDNDALESIEIPDSVTEIGIAAFESCSSLKRAKLSGSLKAISDSLFQSCALDSVIIPSGVTSIGAYSFSGCSFTEIIIPDSVTEIKPSAFSYCRNLKEITISKNITSIGNSAFSDCDALQSVTICNPNCTLGFGYGVFDNGFVEGVGQTYAGTLYGLPGSTTEEYANNCGCKFETIGEAPQQIKGDYNADDEVTVADAVLLARFVSEDTTLTSEQITDILKAEPDYDSDGLVTILDVAALLQTLGAE